MENVPGFVHMYGGNTVERMFEAVEALRSPRYSLAGPFIVNAASYGVPQLRERVLFIGSRSDLHQVTAAPPPTCRTPPTVLDALGDLAFLRPWESADTYDPSLPAAAEYQDVSRQGRLHKRLDTAVAPGQLLNHEAARHSPEVIARFSLMRQGEGLESIPRPAWNRYLQTRKKWCVRLHESRPANTVVTLPDDLVHYSQPRILTVREAARLQSFDDTFGFLGPRATGGGGAGNKKRNQEVPQYTQVGNAIPPLLAKAIGDHLLSALQEAHEGIQPAGDQEAVAA
jgi:DNA (cytosine-5)-methyltransferase 1